MLNVPRISTEKEGPVKMILSSKYLSTPYSHPRYPYFRSLVARYEKYQRCIIYSAMVYSYILKVVRAILNDVLYLIPILSRFVNMLRFMVIYIGRQ